MKGPKQVYVDAGEAADFIRGDNKEGLKGLEPTTMIVLGSGCGKVADSIEPVREIAYASIPGMPESSVAGHKGALLLGRYQGKDVVAFQGRNHYYEGNSAQDASFMVYLAKHLGARFAVMTAAVGVAPTHGKEIGDEDRYPAKPGDVLLVKTVYPNLLPSSLRGPTDEEAVGPRFNGAINMPSMYLKLLANAVAQQAGLGKLAECVYIPRQGPNYETPAEVTLLSEYGKILGETIVGGMSLVPELEAANMLGIDTVAFNVVTNQTFDMASLKAIETDTAAELGQLLDGGVATYTMKEAARIVGGKIAANQPNHEEVAQMAGSDPVTTKLENIIGGIIKAVRF